MLQTTLKSAQVCSVVNCNSSRSKLLSMNIIALKQHSRTEHFCSQTAVHTFKHHMHCRTNYLVAVATVRHSSDAANARVTLHPLYGVLSTLPRTSLKVMANSVIGTEARNCTLQAIPSCERPVLSDFNKFCSVFFCKAPASHCIDHERCNNTAARHR